MRIAVYGAGAIGGYLGALLDLAGEDVTLIGRGPHLEAMRNSGVRLRIGDEERIARPACSDAPGSVGQRDVVIVTLKAHAVSRALAGIGGLLGPETVVVTASNGIPWWYCYRLPGPWENRRLESVDPGGAIWDAIGPERVIGCVAYPAAEVVAPGVIRHLSGDRFVLGEPSNEKSPRARRLAGILIGAGLRAPLRDIRQEIWIKLWGNLAFNPISALTLATLDTVASDPGTRALARTMMLEAQSVAEKLGVHFPIDVERRIRGAAEVGAHRTSMLQDLERGRPLEIDALVTAVQEMGGLVDIPTPAVDAVLALIRLRARAAQA